MYIHMYVIIEYFTPLSPTIDNKTNMKHYHKKSNPWLYQLASKELAIGSKYLCEPSKADCETACVDTLARYTSPICPTYLQSPLTA